MSDRILVAYATRAGSTKSVAEAIGKTLTESGVEVDVRPVTDTIDLSPYSAVIAGSAIQSGKWLPEAVSFVETNKQALSRKPFAAFLVCITMASANASYRQGVHAWLRPVRTIIRPVGEGFFAGELNVGSLPFSLDSLMLRAAVALTFMPSGDHRDWAAIREWTNDIRPQLLR